MVTATDSADSSLQVGPPRHAASPHPTRPPAVSRRTSAKFTARSVVNDMACGRLTGMSARMTRTWAIFTPFVSLGVGPTVVGRGAAPGKAAGIEEREVERGPAVEQPLGHVAPGGRRVLEAVTTEAHGEEETLHVGRRADDG